MDNNKKKEKNKCLFSSKNIIKNEKYIQSSKFFSNNSFLIFNEKSILKYIFNYNSTSNILDSIQIENEFLENNYIYDYDIISNQYELNTNICICSKDNPIRILDDKLSLIKSFSLENNQKDKHLSSIFIKYEPYGINIYTGKNYLSKIDLIKQKKIQIIYNKNYNYLSCFDFNIKYSCYFLGSYSNNLLMCDYKTDKIVNIYKQDNSANQIKILNTKEYKILVGYRNTDYISLFDIRKMNKYICKLERNAMTTKKMNFILDNKEENLYSGTIQGKLLNYSKFDKIDINNEMNNQNKFDKINKEEIDIGINNCISSIDLNNDLNLLIITSGEKNYDDVFYSLNNNSDSDDNCNNKKEYKESLFHIYKI